MPHKGLRCTAAATALLLLLGATHLPSQSPPPLAKPTQQPNVRINQPPVRPPAEWLEAQKAEAWQAWDAKKNHPKST